MPVPKGYRKPVEILRLAIGSAVTQEHVAAMEMAARLRQTVTARVSNDRVEGKGSSFTIVLEARPA